MVLQGQLAVRSLDLRLAGAPRHLQEVIVVFAAYRSRVGQLWCTKYVSKLLLRWSTPDVPSFCWKCRVNKKLCYAMLTQAAGPMGGVSPCSSKT